MTKAILGIGIPGSGKTTALKPFAEKNGYTYISTDVVRAEINGNAADHTRNKEAWATVYSRALQALRRGETIVIDATFVDDVGRKDLIKFVRDYGAEKVQGVFADVPFDIASERNAARERVVPEHAMERMRSQLEAVPPNLDDGFDSIFTINEFQELREVTMKDDNNDISREFKPKLR